MRLSKRLNDMTPYFPGGKPCDVVLNANESFLLPSQALQEEMATLLKDFPFNRYPDPRAEELCKAFAAFYDVNWECVTAGNGSDELIDLLFSCLVESGDKVLTVRPDFSMYGFGAYMNDVQEVVYEKNDYQIDVDVLLDMAKSNDVAMIIFSNPCNPTGMVLSRTEVIRLIDGFDGIVVVDEAYMDFAEESVLDLAGTQENLVVLKTFSKALAMASLRIGMAITTPTMTRLLQTGKAPYNVGRLTQALGTCVMAHSEELREGIAQIKESTAQLVTGITELVENYAPLERLLPTATNYVYLITPMAQEIFENMQNYGVLVRQSADNALRISAGTIEENNKCLEALEACVKELML